MWGKLRDADTEQGIRAYASAGLNLQTPTDLQGLSMDKIRRVAQACSDLLDATYKGNYPQSTKDVEALAASIARSETLMFTLLDGERVIAMASLVHRSSSLRGQLGFAELSKAAKLPGSIAAAVSVRHLSKYRLFWACENLPGVDFLYGSPRVASEGKDGAPGGKQAQSVWWGGRRHGVNLPLLATNVGWNFRVGGIEPLTGFVLPTNAQKWAIAVNKLPVFVPNEAARDTINTLFVEGTDGCAVPRFMIAPVMQYDEPITLREARPPSADIVTKYYVTRLAEHLAERSMAEVDEQLYHAISQKIIVESDIAETPAGAQIMRHLLANGWTLVGWQPSEVVYGGVCPMFARLNPLQLGEIIQPVHHTQYFDESGLGHTRQVLDGMYAAMYSQAHAHTGSNPPL